MEGTSGGLNGQANFTPTDQTFPSSLGFILKTGETYSAKLSYFIERLEWTGKGVNDQAMKPVLLSFTRAVRQWAFCQNQCEDSEKAWYVTGINHYQELSSSNWSK